MHLAVRPIEIGGEIAGDNGFSVFLPEFQKLLHGVISRLAILHGIGNHGCIFALLDGIGIHPRAGAADDIIPILAIKRLLLCDKLRLGSLAHLFIADFAISVGKSFCPPLSQLALFCGQGTLACCCILRGLRCFLVLPTADEATAGQCQHKHNRNQCHAFFSFALIHNLHQPFLQCPFPIGEAGCQCCLFFDAALRLLQNHQTIRLAIRRIPALHRHAVAGNFQIPLCTLCHPPDQRVAPMDASCGKQQQLIPQILPPPMDQLMTENHFQLLRGVVLMGQIDSCAE